MKKSAGRKHERMVTAASKVPAIIQKWNAGSTFKLKPKCAPLYLAPPRVGIVIGTFAAVPYIHLQLEARRRFFPDIPLLVHDDASHESAALAALCRKYDCDFETNDRRQAPMLGDLSAFVGGLEWAAAREFDILLKVSRRWVFLTNWVPSLQALAVQSQYATFGSYTTSFNFGFRTECVGLAVAVWKNEDFLVDALYHLNQGQSVFVEVYVHDFARRFERKNCETAEKWRAAHPMREERNGYALWTLLGTDRCEKSPLFLWHDCCTPEDYLEVSQKWDLPYAPDDFTDPNQGGGSNN